ncbi:hypothetical protein EV426DRAFT_210872 [Tirmania nivea]|nr:hypothetical protein EV426DRAFT_210872 [Tirmania nivea]
MSSPASSKPLAPRVFDDALREFKKQLPAKDLAYFEAVGLQDVEETIKKIELEQRAKRRMQNLTRIQPFLQVIAQYGKVIEVFLNASTLIAFVWGPIKFLLNVASTYLEAFDMLLSAYEELAECLPLYTQYESHFHNSPYMYKALGYVYKDFLNFHLRVYKLMKSCTTVSRAQADLYSNRQLIPRRS